MDEREVPILATSIDESRAHEPQFLDFMVATLKESWGINLYLRWPSNYEDFINNRDIHWRKQMEAVFQLLSDATSIEGGFCYDDSMEPWTALSSFLQEELRFLSQSYQEVQAFHLQSWPHGDIHSELSKLLEYLLTAQLAVTQWMECVQEHIEYLWRCEKEAEKSRKAA